VKVLERGPVHEAFAQPGAEVRGPGMTAPKAPPEPIPEVPPDTKPEGENVRWVPGYWSWDADQKDFIWVSGFWRNAPAGREWSAGKWKEVDGKWTYLPGSWRPTDLNSWRIDLPKPPASVENGPSTPTDNPDGIWIPGAWEFRNEKYVWRPGYWAQSNGDRMWVPSQYLATPYGYSYVPGYWDYPLEDRGILNAPVCFTQPLWQTPGWAYRPRFAIGCGYGGGWGNGGLFSSLYIGPGFNNYYYGNYGYGNYGYGGGSWLGIGFGFGAPFWGLGGYGGYVPWYGGGRGYYNPTWKHYCYLNRNNPNYAKQIGNSYVGRAIGAPHPGHAGAPRPTPVTMNRPGVAGAVNSGVRSATQAAARPAPPPAQAPLVQPASQVAKTISTVNATRAATQPSATAGAGNRPAITQPGGGVAITPNRGGTVQAPPVHASAGNVPRAGNNNGGGGVTITPRGGVNPPANQPNNPLANQNPRGNDRPAPAPVNNSPAAPVIRAGGTQSVPVAPVIRSAPSAPPVIRSAPSAPPVIRSAPPVMRSTPGNFGGGRPAGGGGAAPRPGGGGGGAPKGGGKR